MVVALKNIGVKPFSAIFLFSPSVNNLFLNVSRGGRVKTAKYRAWEKAADAAMPSLRDALFCCYAANLLLAM